MSSDESFLWTSASNSNSDSDDSSTSHKPTEMKSELKDDFVKNEVTGKLKKVKYKVRNGKGEQEVSHNNCIKDEPTSDVDTKIIKNEFNKNLNNTVDKTFDDSYLNLRVKEEQLSCFDDSDIPIKKKKKNKKRKHEEVNNEDRSLDLQNTQTEVSNYEDKVMIEETVISRSYPNRDDQISATEATNANHKKKKKKRRSSGGHCDETNISEITCNNDSDQKCIDENNLIDRNHFESDELESSVRNVSKVSDHIQFEEDISDMESKETKELTESMREVKFDQKKIRRYLKKNANLQPISSKTKQDSIITDMDDVWLLKCPQDVDILLLKDIPLSLSNKTKLKMGGKVYDYMIDDNSLRLPIMTYHNQNKPVIKTLTTNGCIILKNKVPKVHIPDNEIMVNDQTNFIPLPDTKCRHPLFGIHYKKLIKVPSEISKRLNTENLNCLAVQDSNEKRKKHKKNKKSLENYGELQDKMKIEPELSSKKKKRKLSTDTNSPVKSKKVKYDPDSAQTWDSEKAIEENLFNF